MDSQIPRGDYTLYVDLDNGQWKLIVNKTLMAGGRHIWGKITLSNVGGAKGKLLIEWENVTAFAPFTVK